MRASVLGLILWCACTTPPDSPSSLEPDPAPVSVDHGDVGAILTAALAAAPSYNANEVRRVYDAALMAESSGCPGDFGDFWFNNCDSGAGSFDGYAFYYDDGAYGWSLYAAARVDHGEDRYQFSGQAYTYEETFRGAVEQISVVYGTFQGGAGAFGQPSSVALQVRIYNEGLSVDLDGALSGFAEPGVSVDFEEMSFDREACALEPSGRVWTRSATGRWSEVVFDPEDACDGCGAVFDRSGNERGSACVEMPEGGWSW